MGATYVYSVFAKAGTRTVAALSMNAARGWFDLTNGVVGATPDAGVTTSISNAGGGWYRCTIIKTATATPDYPGIKMSPGDGVTEHNGAVGNYIYAWGFQAKRYPVNDALGYTPSTGYIATTTAAKYDLPYEWNAALASQGILIEEQRTNLALEVAGIRQRQLDEEGPYRNC